MSRQTIEQAVAAAPNKKLVVTLSAAKNRAAFHDLRENEGDDDDLGVLTWRDPETKVRSVGTIIIEGEGLKQELVRLRNEGQVAVVLEKHEDQPFVTVTRSNNA